VKIRKVLFTDALDKRVLQAARYMKDNEIAQPILCEKPFKLRDYAEKNRISTKGLTIHPPLHDPNYRIMEKEFNKALQVSKIKSDPLPRLSDHIWYGLTALKMDFVDMVFAGSHCSVNLAARAALTLLKDRSPQKTAFGYAILSHRESGKTFLFADCVVNPQPSSKELANIAAESASAFRKRYQKEPKVGLLSFSTHGSADHPKTEIVRKALPIIQKENPQILVEGELQFDAAVVPEIATKKVKNSKLLGTANVLVFPNLNSANIGCKIAEHIAGYEMKGFYLAGLEKQVHLISSSATVEDIKALMKHSI
jgi:phosphotransacetylase